MAHIKSVSRYHDISCGHRVVGHEGKCRFLHGHNYRVYFDCVAPEVDAVGRIIDFSVIKEQLCLWVEDVWDHKMLLWNKDPLFHALNMLAFAPVKPDVEVSNVLEKSLHIVPFNPTAENMAGYLLETIGPRQLAGTGVTLRKVTIEETRKCSATAEL